MFLPEVINIVGRDIKTLSIFTIIGLVCWGFIMWYESRKDGFRTERFFDLIFLSLGSGAIVFFLLRYIYDWATVYSPSHLILRLDKELLLVVLSFVFSLLPVLIFSKKWKWSTFRILDIYVQSYGLLLLFISAGAFLVSGQKEYIIFVSLLLSLYVSVLKFRGYKFSSGFIFSMFLFFLAVVGFIFFRRNGYLLYYPLLFIIGVVNLYLRGNKYMVKGNFPNQFVQNIKRKLLKKDAELAETQQELVYEDPYLQVDRSIGNSEFMDEAQEDMGKNITDAQIGFVEGLRLQVKKALAAINIGRYGTCEVCGNKIDTARLKVYPEATNCVECATDISQENQAKGN
ncbi:MAG: TraR/DksA C4-type zinc finger protein [Patescibacteria group bacterium]